MQYSKTSNNYSDDECDDDQADKAMIKGYGDDCFALALAQQMVMCRRENGMTENKLQSTRMITFRQPIGCLKVILRVDCNLFSVAYETVCYIQTGTHCTHDPSLRRASIYSTIDLLKATTKCIMSRKS